MDVLGGLQRMRSKGWMRSMGGGAGGDDWREMWWEGMSGV